MNYAIFRSEPIYTLKDLAQIGSHNKREKKAYNSNPHIISEKTKDNVEIVPLNCKYVKGFHELTKEYEKEHNKGMETEREDRKRTYSQMLDRSKNVVADELVFTASPSFFKDIEYKELKLWVDTCMDFVYKDLGYKKEQVLHATLHMDEKSPHIHCVVIPLVGKLDKRTNTERYTITKKQYIKDNIHLSELQDKYCKRLNENGFDLERGLKGSKKEHMTVKEYKKITYSLEKELSIKETNLKKSINNLEEQFKTNKSIVFDKDSVKVKKETIDCMNQVIKNAKKIEEMEPKLESAFNSLKDFSNNLSQTYRENASLNTEINNLSLRNEWLERRVGLLEGMVDYLHKIIQAIIEFVMKLFKSYNIPKREKRYFKEEFDEYIVKEKDKDDFRL